MNRGIKSFFYILFLSSNLAWSQDSLRIKEFQEIEISERSKHDMLRLPQIRGTEIYAGKKNEVINMSATNADLSTNNSRQIFSKIPGLSIWENDGSGIQTGISTRGLSPNRSWEFNVRQNGFDISSEVFGYPEAYYAPPTEALERIEIVRGAGSLQYGPQFGGLLNYVTKKRIGNKPLSMESFRTIGSYGLINSFSAIGGKYKKLNYYTYLHQRGAKSWRANSLYKTITGSISVTYDITPKWQINAEYTRMTNLSQQAGGLSDSMFFADPQQSIRGRNWFSTPWNNGAVTLQYAPTENTKFTLKSFGTLAERNSVGFTKPITVADTINTLLGTFN
ncbi:MAG: TonB-dependent receptor plug domain-containing protein, partial [Bacteroidota bacterium]